MCRSGGYGAQAHSGCVRVYDSSSTARQKWEDRNTISVLLLLFFFFQNICIAGRNERFNFFFSTYFPAAIRLAVRAYFCNCIPSSVCRCRYVSNAIIYFCSLVWNLKKFCVCKNNEWKFANEGWQMNGARDYRKDSTRLRNERTR